VNNKKIAKNFFFHVNFYLATLTNKTSNYMKSNPKKHKYVAEYEINASVRMLFPYLSSPQGLAQWFAEDVKVVQKDNEKLYDIIWDKTSHIAKITAIRTNAHVKYVFVEEDTDEAHWSFLEFKLSHSDMTDTSFLKIIDYSEMDSDNDLRELWDGLIEQLRINVGAHHK
jgi:uncharacterized protein YndB with AHSA1/START domain